MKKQMDQKIFLVEDHPVMRFGLKMMLQENGFSICGEASNLDEAAKLLPASDAAVAIFDLSLNGENAFPFIEQIRFSLPKLNLIIYSEHDSPLFVENAISLGVRGYVTKADPVETLIEAINAIGGKKTFIGPSIAKGIKDRINDNSGHGATLKSLSAREIEVLTDLGQGLSRIDIAKKHGLSVRTVETYIYRLKQKLGVEHNRELLQKAIKVTHSG